MVLFDEDGDESDDSWPDESDEYVPENVRIEIPGASGSSEVDTSNDSDLSSGFDTSDEVVRTFWAVVFMIKIGVLATSLGLLFVVFRGQLRFGGSVFVVGVLALLVGYRRYRNYQND